MAITEALRNHGNRNCCDLDRGRVLRVCCDWFF